MRIHLDNTTTYITNLAHAIAKDPVSMESWACTHIEVSEHTDVAVPQVDLAQLKQQYKRDFKDCDCDVLCCPDGDMILIGKRYPEGDIQLLANDICETLALPHHVTMNHYDLCGQWQQVRELLQHKIGHIPTPLDALLEASNPPAITPFGEIDALAEVFENIRQNRQARSPIHVLLVEDDAVTRKLVAGVLKDQFAIITAETAEEAMTNYLLHAPDIVFLDINLPDTDGFAVLKQVISLDKEAYVVMFSGNSYLDNVVQALNLGASGFVAKPFKRERLHHYINSYAEAQHKHVG